jgi:uncharacterized membrane protein
MPRAADFRKLGRDALSGNWPLAVLVTLIGALLGGMNFGGYVDLSGDQMSYGPWQYSNFYYYLVYVLAVYGTITFFVGSAVQLGMCCFFINLQRRAEISVNDLFSRFSIFGRALLLRLFMFVLVLAWSLLLIVPGIVAAYRYAMAPYLMSQNTELSAREAVALSKRMMDSHKGRLFCLDLSFIGWFILGGLTFGIGLLFVYPYVLSARAAFFLDLQYHYQLEMSGSAPAAAPTPAPAAAATTTAPASELTPAPVSESATPLTPSTESSQKSSSSGETTT